MISLPNPNANDSAHPSVASTTQHDDVPWASVPILAPHTDLIRLIGDAPPKTAGMKRGMLACLYSWIWHRQQKGQKIEPKFYSDSTGIPRSSIYELLTILEEKGFVRGGDTEPWQAVRIADMDLSGTWTEICEKRQKVSGVRNGRVRSQDNTNTVTKTSNSNTNTINKTKTENDELLNTWNKHATKETYLTRHNKLSPLALQRIKKHRADRPGVDLSMALDAYLKKSGNWMHKLWRENDRAFSLRAVLNFPSFEDALGEAVNQRSDKPATLTGDPWKDHGIEHPKFRPPNRLSFGAPDRPLEAKVFDYTEADEAEARAYYSFPQKTNEPF